MFRNSVLLDHIFAVFDADSDGLIDFSEFIHCLSTISSKASQEEKLKCKCSVFSQTHRPLYTETVGAVSFNVYDSDRDGLISPKELKETMISLMQGDVHCLHILALLQSLCVIYNRTRYCCHARSG